MAHFIERVAGDVLRAIAIEVRQRSLVVVHRLIRIDFDGWIVADTAEFRVLNPQITFDDFGCGDEAKNRDITFCEWAIVFAGVLSCE